MKNISRSLAAVSTLLLVATTTTSHAADWTKNLYLNADAGGIFQQDADFTETGLSSTTAAFNPGVRADIAIGYKLSDSMAVELEPGFAWNSIDTLDGYSLRSGVNIDLYSVPLLVNFVYTFPTHRGWTPYVGVGAGANIGVFDGTLPAVTVRDTDITFAFQAEAGVKYAVTDNSSFGVAYKFLGTTDQSYDLNLTPYYTDHVTLGGIYIHGIFATFTWNF